MESKDRLLTSLYLVIAALALIGTWTANIAFFAQEDTLNPVDWFRWALTDDPVSVSLSIDIAAMAFAAWVFMYVESRRLDIPYFWLYVVLSVLVAVSVMFPVFMAVRQRRLAAGRQRAAEAAQSAGLELRPG